jgi:Heparinase II/III-like protein/Alginate lyase
MLLRHLCLLCWMLFASAAFPRTSAAVEGAGGIPTTIRPTRYQVPIEPANIAATAPTMSNEKTVVLGKPRMVRKHPNTLWDQEDIDHYKEMLKTSKELQLQFADLKVRMDERIATPVNIPAPKKGADDAWLYPGEYFPAFPSEPADTDPLTRFRLYMNRDAEAISDLGTVYVLTGEEKYAEYAKTLLLTYSNGSRYGAPKSLDYRFAQGLTGQLLSEALVLDKLARGYDLIYESKSWSPEERARVHDELLQPLAAEMLYPQAPEVDPTLSFSRQINNRGVIGGTSVLLVGYATDDEELVNAALYGIRTNLAKSDISRRKQFPPPKDWIAATADHPSNGLLTVHFASPGIPGGMWVEGTSAYALYALGSMIDAAEAGWHHGLDLYRYNNCIFKYMFDFPLLFSYPDLTTPGENDSHRDSLVTGYIPTLYEYGYRRYGDPRYLAVVNSRAEKAFLASLKAGRSAPTDPKSRSSRFLNLGHNNSAPPSILYDLDPNETHTSTRLPSINYPLVGFGVLRTPAARGDGIQNLILSYGPSASHGHPDKLHIDLYAFNDVLMPSPGIQFPYVGNALLSTWYKTTIAHNTLTVDEKVQEFHEHDAKRPDVRADQAVYGPSESVGVQRAWTDSAYPGVTMDRAVFLTTHYLADLFGAFSDMPHRYDLAWHIRGYPSSNLKFTAGPFPDPPSNGYNVLTDVRQAPPTNNSWSMNLALGGHTARLLAVGGISTQAIIGDGGVYVDVTSTAPQSRPTAPTILERRDDNSSTIFANVLDLSDAGYVKNVTQEGGIDSGFGLLNIETTDGVDLCFASYRAGVYKAAGLETDALQAVVETKDKAPEALYLGGGTTLKIADAAIKRSEVGLAYIEKGPSGHYTVGNPSPTGATVTVKLAALKDLEAFNVDEQGRLSGEAEVRSTASGEISVRLKGASKIEFLPKDSSMK